MAQDDVFRRPRRDRVAWLFCALLLVSGGLTALLPNQYALAGPSELDKLKAEYMRVLKEYREYQKITRNPKKYDELKVGDAKERMVRLTGPLKEMKKKIEQLGGKVPDYRSVKKKKGTVTLRPKPGDKARASLKGKKAKKRVETLCQKYGKPFKRPVTKGGVTIALPLPSRWKNRGYSRGPGLELREIEDELVKHLVECRDEWNRKEALDWDDKRKRLAQKLVAAEKAFAFNFALIKKSGLPGYIDVDNKGRKVNEIKKIVKAKDLYRKLAASGRVTEEARRYFNTLLEIARKYAKIPKTRFKDPTFEFGAAVAWQRAEEARKRFWKLKGKHSNLVKEVIRLKEEAINSRIKRGVDKINTRLRADKGKKLLPEEKFRVHKVKDFLKTGKKSLVSKLLGKKGMDILISESRRRYKAIRAYGRDRE